MGTITRAAFLGFGLIAFSLASVSSADAKCTRLAFSVNDYGKTGPAADAKKLLDKYIADWTAKRSIRGYRVGPKSVKCKLFLDFGFFDEYTCRAEATVCWGSAPPKLELRPSQSGEPEAVPGGKPQTAQINTAPVQVKAKKPGASEASPPRSDDGYNQVYESR